MRILIPVRLGEFPVRRATGPHCKGSIWFTVFAASTAVGLRAEQSMNSRFHGKTGELVQALAMEQARNIGSREQETKGWAALLIIVASARAPRAVIEPHASVFPAVFVRDHQAHDRASPRAGDRSAEQRIAPSPVRPRGQRSANYASGADCEHRTRRGSRQIEFVHRFDQHASLCGSSRPRSISTFRKSCVRPTVPGVSITDMTTMSARVTLLERRTEGARGGSEDRG